MNRIALAFLLILLLTGFAEAQNYDEAKTPSYTLPEVLRTAAGKRVRNKATWEKDRRPEVVKLFENAIYGQMPTAYDSIKYTVNAEEGGVMNENARLKEIEIEVFKNIQSVKIALTLFIPAKTNGPVPVFLLINNRGKELTDPKRETKSEFWPAEMIVDSGYAVAAFHVSDLAPDQKDTYMNGVLRLYPDQLQKDNGMKAIGAWAWGASRAIDYFETDKDIDAGKVIVVGHSRGGKAALWAAAQDQRFAACITNCSGNTGAALARRRFGETVKRINTTFPHWFNNNYKRYNDKEDALPVDQHMLIALIAPRPVYATNATKDLWADPKGTFLAVKNAEPVYELYNVKSKLPATPPQVDHAIYKSPVAYHIHEGEHNMTLYDWQQFVGFAKFNFGKN